MIVNKGLSQIVLIIGVLAIFLLVGAYFLLFSSKNSTIPSSLNSNLSSSPSSQITSPTTVNLEVNQFFPKSVLSFQIKPLGGKLVKSTGDPYYVGPWKMSEIGLDGSSLKRVPISEAYTAYYGTGNTKIIVLHEAKLTFNEDAVNLKALQDAALLPNKNIKLSLPLDSNVTYWAIYSDKVAKDEVAGDARILFNNQTRYVQIQVTGSFTKEEFINIVKNYVDSVNNGSAEVVAKDQMLNESELKRIQNR